MPNNENIMIDMLISLNRGVIIKPDMDDKLTYVCSIPCKDLILPRRFIYNASKNQIINIKTGNSIIIKYNLEKAKEDFFEPEIIEEPDFYNETLREESIPSYEDLFKTETIPEFEITPMDINDSKKELNRNELFESSTIPEYKDTYSKDHSSETISEYKDLSFDGKISRKDLLNSNKNYSEEYAKYIYGMYSFNSKPRYKRFKRLKGNTTNSNNLPIIDKRKELIIANIELVRRCLELIKYLNKEEVDYDSKVLTSLIIRFEKVTHEDNAINELNYIKDKLFSLSNSLCNKFIKKEHLHNKKNSI